MFLALAGASGCAPEGPSAFVTFNVKPNDSCEYSKDSTNSDPIPTGKYDIAGTLRGDKGNLTTCSRPYLVHLLVNSYLRSNSDATLGRAEPNILQLDRAEIRLMDLLKRTIKFEDSSLINPFLVTTANSLPPAMGTTASTGLATVEAIPVAYAPYLLQDYVGQQILAEIQIFGTTTGGVDIDFKPFVYPIEICNGCMSRCKTKVESAAAQALLIPMGSCNDQAGADDRYCIDEGC